MAFKLFDMAELRWRRLDGASLLLLVRPGVKLVDRVRHEQPTNASRPNEDQPSEAT